MLNIDLVLKEAETEKALFLESQKLELQIMDKMTEAGVTSFRYYSIDNNLVEVTLVQSALFFRYKESAKHLDESQRYAIVKQLMSEALNKPKVKRS